MVREHSAAQSFVARGNPKDCLHSNAPSSTLDQLEGEESGGWGILLPLLDWRSAARGVSKHSEDILGGRES